MRGIGFAVVLALVTSGGGQSRRDVAVVETGIVPRPARTTEAYRSPPNPACAPDRAGRFANSGNRWGRYGDLCIDQVQVNFDAFPDPTLGYRISSDRCRQVERFGPRRPADFFERPVPEQIGLLKTDLASDLRAFARQCGIRFDPAPFVDDRFDQFYAAYGDGWWFDRLDDGFRLTPKVTSE